MPNSHYETTPAQRKLSAIGRKMMDLAITEKDYVRSGRLSTVGSRLTEHGRPGGKKHEFAVADLMLVDEVMNMTDEI